MSKVYNPRHYSKDCANDIEIVIDGLPPDKAAHLWNILKYWDRRNDKGQKENDLEKANNYAYRLVYGEWKDDANCLRPMQREKVQ